MDSASIQRSITKPGLRDWSILVTDKLWHCLPEKEKKEEVRERERERERGEIIKAPKTRKKKKRTTWLFAELQKYES